MLTPFVRTLILYFFVIVAIRLMGKRQVGEMQPTELVVTILISEVAAVPMQNIDIPLSHGIVPIFTLVAAELLISVLILKSIPFRRVLTGTPVIIIKNGQVDQKALKKLRITIDDVLEDLRLKDVFDLKTVRFAQIETNGQLSVLLYGSACSVTSGDLGIENSPVAPFYPIITDGKLCAKWLEFLNKDERWLKSIIKRYGACKISDVFLLCADEYGNFIFTKKEGQNGF